MTPNCFPISLANAESMEPMSICSETGFISEKLYMKCFCGDCGCVRLERPDIR